MVYYYYLEVLINFLKECVAFFFLSQKKTLLHIIVTKQLERYTTLSKKYSYIQKNIGWIIGSIGVGMVLTFVVPFWGWIIAVGGGLIYAGWYLINNGH